MSYEVPNQFALNPRDARLLAPQSSVRPSEYVEHPGSVTIALASIDGSCSSPSCKDGGPNLSCFSSAAATSSKSSSVSKDAVCVVSADAVITGVVAVMVESETTTTSVAFCPPSDTDVAFVKLLPVTVID